MNRTLAKAAFVIQVFILILTASCDKEVRPPIVGRTTVSDIKTHEAVVVSWIFHNGDAEVKECGFCWNTEGNPAIDDYSIKAELTDKLPVLYAPYIQEVTHDMVVCTGATVVEDNVV